MTQLIGHPLDHAYFRLDWAKKRLGELEAIYRDYINKEAELLSKQIRIHLDMDSSIPNIYFPPKPCQLIPVSFPILVGEIAQHLRACLDYLVYRLAILDTGSPQERTQFPIDKTPDRFRGKKPHPFLAGISAAHTAAIERLQPYNGVEWTKRLAAISNRDKHMDLTVNITRSAIRMRVGLNPNPPAGFSEEPGLYITGEIAKENIVFRQACNIASDQPAYMQFHVALFITFDDGLHVLDTLQEIEAEVRNMLTNFKQEF